MCNCISDESLSSHRCTKNVTVCAPIRFVAAFRALHCTKSVTFVPSAHRAAPDSLVSKGKFARTPPVARLAQFPLPQVGRPKKALARQVHNKRYRRRSRNGICTKSVAIHESQQSAQISLPLARHHPGTSNPAIDASKQPVHINHCLCTPLLHRNRYLRKRITPSGTGDRRKSTLVSARQAFEAPRFPALRCLNLFTVSRDTCRQNFHRVSVFGARFVCLLKDKNLRTH